MRRTLMTAIAGLTVLTAVSSASLAAASASPSVTRSGTLHLQFMNTSPTSNTETAVATGLFTDGGTNVEHAHNSGVLMLRGGTIRARHSAGKGTQSFNRRTCLFTSSLRGTYRILGGTGKYKGISGHGTYRLSIMVVGARTAQGACSRTKPPVAF